MDNQDFCIYIIDDDKGMRDSLAWLVKSDGYNAATFENAECFLDNLPGKELGCVIADIRMPGISGLELYQKLTQMEFQIPVIIITGHGDISMAVKALKDGVFDFVEKPFDDKIILDSIRMAVKFCEHHQEQHSIYEMLNDRFETLTSREKEVMDKIVLGMSNKQIAAALSISIKTVEVHRSRVMEKMQASSLAALVRMSLKL
ncbi:Tetrathionate reductase two-component response regulator [hydrothermal vent metagenome]|uniref:Tetrathionate reductase two-component response regulator n=1 Tax=hydrothermal vent metagenome TaxID=652676 RepID=A0A3B1BWT1_9ZZZZ